MQHTISVSGFIEDKYRVNDETLIQFAALCGVVADTLRHQDLEVAGFADSAAAALVVVGNHPGETIESLSKILRRSHSGTVRLVDKLVSEGMIERKRANDDSRKAVLTLTKLGAHKRHLIVKSRTTSLRAMLAGLSEADLRGLMKPVPELLASVTEGREHADFVCRFCDETICTPSICPVELSVA